jgi:hypothetical protein
MTGIDPKSVECGMRVQVQSGGKMEYATIVSEQVCRVFNEEWGDGYSGYWNPELIVYRGYQDCHFIRIWADHFDVPAEHFLHRCEVIQDKKHKRGLHRLKLALYGIREK